METELLTHILVILGLSTGVVFICHRLRVPAIVGFLAAGFLAGPGGFSLVPDIHMVAILAEIGVVLLLFTIGVEFSLKNLFYIRRLAILGGGFQVLATAAVFTGLFLLLGRPLPEAVFWGWLISLSSTAIVLRLVSEKGLMAAPHGRASLGILIFQDLAVVPMVLAVPLLAGNGGGWSGPEALMAAGRMVGVFLFLWAASRYVVPHLLYQVARTRSREIFLFSVIVIVLATAWLTQEAGLSLALGAFLAGLMISESEYNHQALASILPFRDVFASFFFVSIGMMFSPGILVTHPLQVAGLTLFIILAKSLVTVLAGLVAGLTIRTSVLAGLFLAQVGEFSFILSESGMEYGLLSQDAYGLFLVCSVLTMAISPALAAVAPAVARWSQTLPLPARLKREAGPEPGDALAHRENHLVIVGYGVNGRNVSAAARYAGVPYVIVEMNPDTVRTEKARGEPILFGDASMPVVLSHAGLERARVAVVAINDPAATRAAVQNIKEKNPSVHLIVRTRFVNEITPLRDLGADEVIPEEFETSVEIFSRVLNRYQVPESDIREMVDRVRGDTYGMLRSLALAPGSGAVLPDLADSRISTLRVCPGSRLEGRSLAETALRKKHGVTVLAVRRDGATLANPDPDQRFIAGDALVVLGTPADIRSVSPLVAAKDGLPAGEPSKSG